MPWESRGRTEKEGTDGMLERGVVELYCEGTKGWGEAIKVFL